MTNETHVMKAVADLAGTIGRPVRLMEVCGTHTMTAFRSGLRSLLPEGVALLSGPGCPVCVTPNGYIDHAIAIAEAGRAVVATFGDMIRVPGTQSSLEKARARGAEVAIVYSPLDALQLAGQNPGRRVVFLGVGFETTAPTVAWTILEAARTGVSNYSVLCGHKLIPPAMAAMLSAGEVGIDGFMCPGHVSVIIGSAAYEPICRDYRVPCVVAGFEAADMARAIRMLLQQIVDDRAEVETEYSRSVSREGNTEAQRACEAAFEVGAAEWRGLGPIPGSGLQIREAFAAHDASKVFGDLAVPAQTVETGCLCGEVLRGIRLPTDCGLFGRRCTPEQPIGPCMVSSEGACAAYFKYGGSCRKTS